MSWIPAGRFIMGSPASEPGRRADESPRTLVVLTQGFWMARTHVTIAQWRAVMGTGPRTHLEQLLRDDKRYLFGERLQTLAEYIRFSPEHIDDYVVKESDDLPMTFVTWEDAREFGLRLTGLERAAGRLADGYEYDLPTEAQWEYAARAGTRGATYGKLEKISWYDANSMRGYVGRGFALPGGATGGPRDVGGKAPNRWGLYDMAGNVWQWCLDAYSSYPGGRVVDPTGPASGNARVNRGGSFGSSAADERSASRAGNPSMEASAYRGFRIALVSRRPG